MMPVADVQSRADSQGQQHTMTVERKVLLLETTTRRVCSHFGFWGQRHHVIDWSIMDVHKHYNVDKINPMRQRRIKTLI